ncbi:hypothetical protein F0R75_03015 [Francisella marina]|uniref:Uncharacterized protein n=2 Tax=Francisella marina TaxID=2249302 RepID=A0ABX5ZL81_9GAMM|nr:hypothetical protein F0R74_04215 [Francisella marina]QEO60127.1 hypothetical protein F0R75_03015 [Francisella marina]
MVFLTSFVIGVYYNQNVILFFGIFLIILSILFEAVSNKQVVETIILPNSLDNNSLTFVINAKESDFWTIRKYIVINSWIYLYAVQQGSNKKIKIWLHKSNFKNKNDIRDLTKYMLFTEK